jgi:tetratricopeptide (TPR) repeat protein
LWPCYDEGVRLFGVSLSLLALGILASLDAEENLVSRGFDHFYSLEYDQALALFQQVASRDSNSPDAHNHVAETILFREMLRNGALESELVSGDNPFLRRAKMNPAPETGRAFLNEVTAAISLASKRLEKNPNDTGALYALGIAHGLRANYNWLVNKSWRESLSDATAARRQHNRITELEPANVDATLVQGLHDYVVGSLPIVLRMVGFLGGIRGDKEKGLQTVEDVARRGDRNRVDAQILLCALYRRENQPMRAVPLIEDLMRHYPRNYLLPLELSQMYSMAGDGQKALAAVEALARAKAAHTPGLDRISWEKIYFQEGTIQFWYRDLDHSLDNLKKVAAAAENLDLNTGAFAYLRIGQIYDMTRNRDEAIFAYKKCIAFAPEADAARESRKYLAAPYRRL